MFKLKSTVAVFQLLVFIVVMFGGAVAPFSYSDMGEAIKNIPSQRHHNSVPVNGLEYMCETDSDSKDDIFKAKVERREKALLFSHNLSDKNYNFKLVKNPVLNLIATTVIIC